MQSHKLLAVARAIPNSARVRALRLFYLAMFFAMGAVLPILALLLGAKGMSPAEYGWLIALLPATRTFAPPLWGALSDRYVGPLRLIGINGAACGLAMLALGFAQTERQTSLAFVVWALCASSLIPLVEAHTYRVLRERAAHFGRIRVFGSVGFAISALALGAVEIGRVTLPFFVAAAGYLGAALVASRLHARERGASEPRLRSAVPRGLGTLLSLDNGLLWLGSALYYAAHGIFDVYFGPLAHDDVGVQSHLVSRAWGIGVVCEMAVLMLAPRVLRGRAAALLLPTAGLVAALRWFLLSRASEPWHLMALAPLHALTFGLWYLCFVHENQRAAPPFARATAQGIAAACMGLGMVAATVLGGYAVQQHGARSVFRDACWAALGASVVYGLRALVGRRRAPCAIEFSGQNGAMDEQRFRLLADRAFRQIMDGFDAIDADDADVDTAGNTIHIAFRDGQRCVVNTQAAVSQIWLAGGRSAWHFSYDEPSNKWLHDKGTGDELFSVIARITREAIGQDPQFAES